MGLSIIATALSSILTFQQVCCESVQLFFSCSYFSVQGFSASVP